MSEKLKNHSESPSSTKWDSLANPEDDNRRLHIKSTSLGNVDVLYSKGINDFANSFLNENIMPISDKAIDDLAEYAIDSTRDKNVNTVRDELYKSAYDLKDIESIDLIENEVEAILTDYDNIDLFDQDSSYKWVVVNDAHDDCESRFYIAPTADNIHKMILRLAQSFSENDTQVAFKYQLSTSKSTNQCDRIIIYIGIGKKREVEQIISNIYEDSPELFEGAERSPIWISDSNIPGVYFAPETPGYSYGDRAMRAIRAAKSTSDYLWENMPAPDRQDQKTMMKVLIPSIMLRHELFATNDGQTIHFVNKLADKSLGSFYSEVTRIRHPQSTGDLIVCGNLRNKEHPSETHEYAVTFSQSEEGKKAFLENFYTLGLDKEELPPGITERKID